MGRFMVCLLALLILASLGHQSAFQRAYGALPSKTNIKIGVLLPLTGYGYLGTLGSDLVQAVNIAISQANRILGAAGTGVNFTDNSLIVDANLVGADQGYKTLVDQLGAQIIIGPATTSEVVAMKDSSNLRQVPVISAGSTGPGLTNRAYIFRIVAPDSFLLRGLALHLYTLGIRHLAIVTADYLAGGGWRESLRASFLNFSGTEVTDVTFSNPSNFTTAIDYLNSQVGTLIGNAGGDTTKVGVVDIALEPDQVQIYDYARNKTNLPNVRWSEFFGPDEPYLLPSSQGGSGTQDTAAFQSKVNLTGLTYTRPPPGPEQTNMDKLFLYGAIVNLVGGGTVDLRGTGYVNVTGHQPLVFAGSSYTEYAYDAAWMAMLSTLKANSYIGSDIAAQIGSTANSTIGGTGVLTLDRFGDRASQDYVYWSFNKTSTAIPGCSTPPCYFIDETTGPFYQSDIDSIVSALPPASEIPGATQAQTYAPATSTIQTYAFGTTTFTIETNAQVLNVSYSGDPHLQVLLYARFNTFLNATMPSGFQPMDVTINGTATPFTSASNTGHQSIKFSFNPFMPGRYIAVIAMNSPTMIPPGLPLLTLLVVAPLLLRRRKL